MFAKMLILCLEHLSRLIQDTVIWDTFHFVQLCTFSCGSFMGSTLFESFTPAIRPHSENRIAVMRRTKVINVFNTFVRDFHIVLQRLINFVSSRVAFGKHACKECHHESLSNTEVFSYCLLSPGDSAMLASATSSLQVSRDKTSVTTFSIQLRHRLLEDNLDVVRVW